MAEIIEMTAGTTVRQMDKLIDRYGCPETIVSDNGTQFSGSLFKQFCERNGIRHQNGALLFTPKATIKGRRSGWWTHSSGP